MKRLLLFFLVLLCFWLYGNLSFAMTSSEAIIQCRENLQTLTNRGLLQIQDVNSVNLSFFNIYGISNGYIIIVGRIGNGENRLYINNLISSGYIRNARGNSNYWAQNDYDSWVGGACYNLTGGKVSDGNYNYNNLVEPFYVYNNTQYTINTTVLKLGAYEEYGGSYIYNNFGFEFSTNYHVTLNGVDCLAYILPYSMKTWNLGQCQNWQDLDELVFYIRDENDIIIASTYYTAQDNFDTTMHIYDNGFLYVIARLLNYRQVYKLEWEAYQGGSMVSNYYDYICFLPPKNTTVDSNGNVIQIGSGDYTTQDSTNDIIDTISNSGDPQVILSTDLFSGDSGDIYNRFGYMDYDNPYKDFILRVFYGIMTTLTSSGNVNLIWPVRDKTIILKSDDFIIQSVTFRILLSGILVFFILYKLYSKLKIVLDELAEGNINYTLNFKDGKFTEYWFF